MTQVFVSYSRPDSDAVEPIKTVLRQAGLSVQEEGEPAGANFGEQLRRGLESTRCVIMVWSKAAAESQWGQEEMRQAIRVWSSGRLVLAALDDSPLPIGLRDITPFRVGGGSPSGLKQLVERAKAIVAASEAVGGEPATATPIGKSAPAPNVAPAGPALARTFGRATKIGFAGVAVVAAIVGLFAHVRTQIEAPPYSAPVAGPPVTEQSKPATEGAAKLPPLAPPAPTEALQPAPLPSPPAAGPPAQHAPTIEELVEAAPPQATIVELPQATVATPYRAELPPFSDDGGKGLRLAAESLPQGLAFEDLGDGKGVIAGLPEQAGSAAAVRIVATNPAGRTAQMIAILTIADRPKPSPPPIVTPSAVATAPVLEAAPGPADREGLFVRGYDGGDCFLVKPLPGERRAYLGVGDQLGPFVQFDEAFKREIGVEPQLLLRLITAAQCPMLDLMRAGVGAEFNAPRIELEDYRVGRNKPLAGKIVNLAGRRAYLILVDNDGGAYRFEAKPQPDGDSASFSVPLIPDDESTGPLQVILAIVSTNPIPALRTFRSGLLKTLAPALAEEARAGSASVGAEFFTFAEPSESSAKPAENRAKPPEGWQWAGPSVSIILGALVAGGVIGILAAWARAARSRRTAKARPVAALALEPPAGGGAQVFVSYSRQDVGIVDDLVRQIEQMGYPVWIDRGAHGSQRYAAPIVGAIRGSKLVALMCSRNAFASDHVIREIYVAGDFKKPFIAFQLDPTDFPDDILYFISGFPRVPVAAVNPEQLRFEIARLVVV